jgi:acetyl-CoA carboxylase biotin carboxyl carrier protein
MKMEIPVVAPRAGVVKEVLTEEGAAVEEGKVLVVLE